MDGTEWDAIVVGGGFFGASLALLLQARVKSVLLLEQEPALMTRASYHNQARVHAGYHYPRSLMTAVRSRINFPGFLQDFAECIVDDFPAYYAIARTFSKVSARQFAHFMGRAGASLQAAPAAVTKLFNSSLIESVFRVREVAFDAAILRRTMLDRLQARGVSFELGARAEHCLARPGGGFELSYRREDESFTARTRWIFNCTYSAINQLRASSGMPLIPLKHELAEMALVEPPSKLADLAVTVMCGPFFSFMPFPDRRLKTLSHVRYTPHHSWHDVPGRPYFDGRRHLHGVAKSTNGPLMIRDAARYLPAMRECRQVDSLWEVKTILPQNELDDGRPILFHHDVRAPGLVTVVGAKLDNVYDLPQDLDDLGLHAPKANLRE